MTLRQWLNRFRARRELQVDKEDPKLLAALNGLYAIFEQYDPENVYNIDETG